MISVVGPFQHIFQGYTQVTTVTPEGQNYLATVVCSRLCLISCATKYTPRAPCRARAICGIFLLASRTPCKLPRNLRAGANSCSSSPTATSAKIQPSLWVPQQVHVKSNSFLDPAYGLAQSRPQRSTRQELRTRRVCLRQDPWKGTLHLPHWLVKHYFIS